MTKEFLNLSVLHLGGLYLRADRSNSNSSSRGWLGTARIDQVFLKTLNLSWDRSLGAVPATSQHTFTILSVLIFLFKETVPAVDCEGQNRFSETAIKIFTEKSCHD